MGWFHKAFGFSSQPALKSVAKGLTDIVSLPAETILGKFNPIPTWDEMQRPGEWFSGYADDILGGAAPYVGTALTAFGHPWAGAAFNTAYSGGKAQEAGQVDWGSLGKEAAVNFGTAAVADWAKNANVPKPSTDTPSAIAGFNQGQSSALASSAAPSMPGASKDLTATAYKLASSGGGALKAATTKAAPGLANQALTATLTPDTQPIAGVNEATSSGINAAADKSRWGDVLGAFGGQELNTANPSGPRIGQDAVNRGVERLGANAYLQQNEKRDKFIPTGQVAPTENTPYGNQLSDVQASTNQAYKDYSEQVMNANKYYAMIDANPGRLDETQMNNWLANPQTVPVSLQDYFKGLKPLY